MRVKGEKHVSLGTHVNSLFFFLHFFPLALLRETLQASYTMDGKHNSVLRGENVASHDLFNA